MIGLNPVAVPADAAASFELLAAPVKVAADPKASSARIAELSARTAEHRWAVLQLNAERQALEAEWRQHSERLAQAAREHVDQLKAERSAHDNELADLKRAAAMPTERISCSANSCSLIGPYFRSAGPRAGSTKSAHANAPESVASQRVRTCASDIDNPDRSGRSPLSLHRSRTCGGG
jgi:hypothetical protein